MMPVLLVNNEKLGEPLNYCDELGIALAVIGLILEAVADQSKFNFRKFCQII